MDARPVCLDLTGGDQAIVGIDGIEQCFGRNAEIDQPGIVEFDIDAFGAFPDHQCLVDTFDQLQAITDGFGITGEFAHGQARCRQRDHGEVNIGKVVVDNRANDAARQLGCLVEHTFAYLVEQVRHPVAGRIILELNLNIGAPRPHAGLDTVHVFNFLNTFFKPVDNL